MPNRQDPRTAWACCIFLTGLVFVLALENRAIRSDQATMKRVYFGFLQTKAGGSTLQEKIKPGSLAVFRANSGNVACGVFK